MQQLDDRRIAILATDGYERSELMEPLNRFRGAGAHVDIVSLGSGSIRSWHDGDWGDSVSVDANVDAVSVDDYDALVLPGGTINPDKLRRSDDAVAFVRDFVASGKPVAAICHAPWMLVEADVLRNRQATSFFSIRRDVENAGARWIDQAAVVDSNIITSRNPDDLPEFMDAIAEFLAQRVVV